MPRFFKVPKMTYVQTMSFNSTNGAPFSALGEEIIAIPIPVDWLRRQTGKVKELAGVADVWFGVKEFIQFKLMEMWGSGWV